MIKTMTSLFKVGALGAWALALSACASSVPVSPSDLSGLDMVNPKLVAPGVVSSGQPSADHLAALKQLGFGTVINLRTAGEDLGFDEAAEAERLGMTYINIPVSMDDLDTETAQSLRSAIAQSTSPALVHCGSGNRVGALFAIGAHELDGASVEDALETGRAAGLTRLEPRIREILTE